MVALLGVPVLDSYTQGLLWRFLAASFAGDGVEDMETASESPVDKPGDRAGTGEQRLSRSQDISLLACLAS